MVVSCPCCLVRWRNTRPLLSSRYTPSPYVPTHTFPFPDVQREMVTISFSTCFQVPDRVFRMLIPSSVANHWLPSGFSSISFTLLLMREWVFPFSCANIEMGCFSRIATDTPPVSRCCPGRLWLRHIRRFRAGKYLCHLWCSSVNGLS